MKMTRWIAAVAASALLLTGCGSDTTPEGLVAALDDDGIGLDPGTSPQRYYDAVQQMCEADGLTLSEWSTRFGVASEAGNDEALERMLVGMGYMCPEQAESLDQLVRAG